jgi:NADH:ubiquinone oxidoreductase subunit F (NADH-binding)
VFRFGADESCGKCTPCRVGARRVEEMSALAVSGGSPGVAAVAEWADTITALSSASLCGHGVGLAEFAESIATHYPAELQACLG